MADDIAVTPGSGATVGADLITSVLYQRVKLIQGIDGVNDGDVSSTAPLQVTLANHGANTTAVKVNVASGGIASGGVASGAIASGAVASGAVASGAFASGSIASGAIAAGAIAAGAASIAENEDVGSADGDRGVKILAVRKLVPANTSGSDADYEFLQMQGGALWTQYLTVGTSTDVSLASAGTTAQLLAANTSRKGLIITNTDANAAYVYFGTTATTTKFTIIIPGGATYTMDAPIYTGRIDVIWAADGSGSLIGSEF